MVPLRDSPFILSRRTIVATSVALAVGILLAVSSYGSVSAGGRSGRELWVSVFDGVQHINDRAAAVAISPDGSRLFVTGKADHRDVQRDFGTVAIDSGTGEILWSATFDGPEGNRDAGTDVVVSPDGGTVFVGGYSFSGSGEKYTAIAYDSGTGAVRWLRRLTMSCCNDDPRAIGVSPDGSTVFLGGQCIANGADHCMVAFAASTGDVIWDETYDGPGNTADEAFALAVSPDGTQVFDTGYDITGPNGEDFATVAYDAATGQKTWVRRQDGNAHKSDRAEAITVSPDSSMVFVTGAIEMDPSGIDYATLAYEAETGRRLWIAQYRGVGSSYDAATAIAASPNGSLVFVTGRSVSATGSDYATVAYEATTGRPVWARRSTSDGDGYDEPKAIVVSPDGATVMVTGEFGGVGPDYGTIAYDATTGQELWRAIYDGGRQDQAEDLVVAPGGSAVYVTGSGKVPGEGFDYVTVAYAT